MRHNLDCKFNYKNNGARCFYPSSRLLSIKHKIKYLQEKKGNNKK